MKNFTCISFLFLSSALYSQSVGIGTSTVNPNAKVLIKSSVAIPQLLQLEGPRPSLSFNNPDGLQKGYLFYNDANFEIGTPSSSGIPITIVPNDNVSNGTTFATNGMVGIGAATPAYWLDVNGRMRIRHKGETAGI